MIDYRIKSVIFGHLIYNISFMKNTQKAKTLIDSFKGAEKVKTIDEIKKKFGHSNITIYRKVKLEKLVVSYNKNSKYYTLPTVPQFNKYGLWFYDEIGFSKYGNLYQTLTTIIDNSATGLSGKELTEILKIKVLDALRILSERNTIKREKIGGENIFFSAKANIGKQQNQGRTKEIKITESSLKFPKYQIVIEILVVIILNNKLEIETLKKELLSKKIKVSEAEISSVIEHYQLKKKNFR